MKARIDRLEKSIRTMVYRLLTRSLKPKFKVYAADKNNPCAGQFGTCVDCGMCEKHLTDFETVKQYRFTAEEIDREIAKLDCMAIPY